MDQSALKQSALKQSPLKRRSDLLAAGFTDGEMRRQKRSGLLTPVRRGTYMFGATPDDLACRHRISAEAALPELAEQAVFSHVTAAVLLGLPVWGIPLLRVHATRSRPNGGRFDKRLHLHAARLESDEIHVAGGLAITSPARTVTDLARTQPYEHAVAVADAALHTHLVTPAELAKAVARCSGWPGAPAARRVIAFADPGSGSVGESRSRVAIAAAGLPPPVLQWEVFDRAGRLIGLTDFAWPHLRTVGEFDGKIKYERLVPSGATAADVVVAEKRREDAIRAMGLAMVRWMWSDIDDFAPLADLIRDSFQVG